MFISKAPAFCSARPSMASNRNLVLASLVSMTSSWWAYTRPDCASLSSRSFKTTRPSPRVDPSLEMPSMSSLSGMSLRSFATATAASANARTVSPAGVSIMFFLRLRAIICLLGLRPSWKKECPDRCGQPERIQLRQPVRPRPRRLPRCDPSTPVRQHAPDPPCRSGSTIRGG